MKWVRAYKSIHMIPAYLSRSLRARCFACVLLGLTALGACSSDKPLSSDVDPSKPGKSDKDSGTGDGDESTGEDEDAGRDEVEDAGKVHKGPTPVTIAQCTTKTSGLSAERLSQLQAGGAPGDMRFIYPYDGTVFPRGLKAPVLMWQGTDATAADVVYVHMKSSWFEYSGCVRPDAAGRIALPQDAWDQAGAQTPGKTDPFTVELSVIRGSVVKGPIAQQLIIAPATLKGSVYYNSYSSPMARAKGAPGGAILRIPAGGEAEVFLGQDGCVGCHSVSAHGNRMVTAAFDFPDKQGIYKLEPNAPVNPPPLRGNPYDNVGLTPDGTYFVIAGGQLVETDTGLLTADAGVPGSIYQPTFSPDGQWLTFADADPNNGYTTLAVMGWKPATRTFSDYRKILSTSVPDAGEVGAQIQWPSFLPDSKAIVFTDASKSDLFLADVATGTVTLLARAMGFNSVADAASDEKTYLPFGAEELHQSFYPTIAPVAAGGYFWVFFDTSRKYGNFDTTKIEPKVEQPPPVVQPDNPWCALFPNTPLCPTPVPPPVDPPPDAPKIPSRQLWVTAIEISADGTYKHDPSAPAFYLPGQEIGANNHRAFAALDPCLAAGKSCESGTECCDGFCTDGMCGVPTERCSETEEACESAADCCDKQEQCINGFCSVVLF